MKKKVAFVVTMIFFVFLSSLFMFSHNFAGQPAGKESFSSVSEIDAEIKKLKDMKLGYEGRAVRHENQAQRLQFNEGEQLTAKKHWKYADLNRQMAAKIQQQIDELEAKKKEMLQPKKEPKVKG